VISFQDSKFIAQELEDRVADYGGKERNGGAGHREYVVKRKLEALAAARWSG
jgi:hypothetical protein